jgi:hypothetical protein
MPSSLATSPIAFQVASSIGMPDERDWRERGALVLLGLSLFTGTAALQVRRHQLIERHTCFDG